MSATVIGLPPQSTPLLSGIAPLTPDGKGVDLTKGLMALSFWLFLNQMQATVNAGSGFEPGGGPPANGDVLTWVAANSDYEPVAPSVTPGAATIDYHTITGALSITASVMPAPTNGMLIVALTMGAGAVQPTWSATDFSKTPGAVSILSGKQVNCLFCADGAGKWMLVAPPAD